MLQKDSRVFAKEGETRWFLFLAAGAGPFALANDESESFRVDLKYASLVRQLESSGNDLLPQVLPMFKRGKKKTVEWRVIEWVLY